MAVLAEGGEGGMSGAISNYSKTYEEALSTFPQ